MLLAPPSRASTLDPGHPAWRTPGIDHAALARLLDDERGRRPKAPAFLERTAKGFEAHGQRILVLPVLFADSGAAPVSRDALEGRFFDAARQASVRSYYAEVSGGRFVPRGVVLPWIRLPGKKSDYINIVQGHPSSCGDCGPRQMVTDALRAAAVSIDLATFDDDGPDGVAGSGDDDGRIDLLVVLHPDAGFENDPSDAALAVLAHQGRIAYDEALAASAGVVGDAYVVASARGPLGVWVHEIGHLLGLEDLYDLEVTGDPSPDLHHGGLGSWSLMAHGTWGGGGEKPSGLDAVSRWRLGWEDRHVTIDAPATEYLDPVRAGLAASIEVRPFGAWGNEMFVLENRRRSDGVVDGDLPGSGVLVYRVDDRVRLNRHSAGYWIELLEADGRRDLYDAQNNGDASDPFQAGTLGPATTPSTQSRTPSPDRIAPVIEIGAPNADERQRIDVFLSETPQLRLTRSLLTGSNQSARAYLRLGETADWDLRFTDLGPTASQASLDTVSVDPRLHILGELPTTLVEVAGTWRVDPPLRLQSVGSLLTPQAARVVLSIGVEGGPARQIELGIPVALGPGLSGADFYDWSPAVLQAGTETTEFTPLDVLDLPLPADAGWITTTQGEARYANDVELTLTSPWFATSPSGRLEFWARVGTESSQSGQAYDGAGLEIFEPDRGWRPLRPTGSPTALILNNSGANTRGLVGLAGDVPDWAPYDVLLPTVETPIKVRVRFGSDSTVAGEGLALANLGTDPAPGRAQIVVNRDAFGQPFAVASFTGNLDRVTTVRFRYRRPLDTTWQPASTLLLLRPDLADVEAPLELPPEEAVLTVGIFAETSASVAPPILLGQVGYVAPVSGPATLQVFPNPAKSNVELALQVRDQPQTVHVYDLRGRRVRTLHVPAGYKRITWDGIDDEGQRVAAGRYLLVLDSNPSVKRSVIFLP